MFFAQVARKRTIPLNFAPDDTDDGYPPHIPNTETLSAIEEALHPEELEGAETVGEMMAALNADEDKK